ncbi:hypothetical protein ACFTAO_15105 [Paenibacillus rhizoplanae]
MLLKPHLADKSQYVVGIRSVFETQGICLNRTEIPFGLTTDRIWAMVSHIPDFNNAFERRYNFIRSVVMPLEFGSTIWAMGDFRAKNTFFSFGNNSIFLGKPLFCGFMMIPPS